MKNIGFYGNCQAKVLSNLIKRIQYIKQNYQIIELKQVQKIKEEDIETLISSLKKIDILVYQKVKGNSKKSTRFLLKYVKSDCQKICIPSCYFEGYNPEFIKIKSNNYPVNNPLTGQLHDIFILIYHLQNRKQTYIERINDIFYNLDLYNETFLDKFFHWTINQLQNRENENKVDIKISDYIINNYKNERLFVDTNHPCPSLYKYIIKEIFDILQIDVDINEEFTLNDLNEAEHGHGHQYAIYPSVLKHLNLKFDINNVYEFDNNILDRKEFTNIMLSFYQTLDYDVLLQSLISNERYTLLKDYLNSTSRDKLTNLISINNNFDKLFNQNASYFLNNIERIAKIAQIYQEENKITEAKQYYRYLIAFEPNNSNHYINFAKLLKKEKAIYEAIGYYQRAIKIEPKLSPYIYRELGDLLSQQNSRIQDAIKSYQQALESKSDWNVGFYLKLANLLIRDEKTDLAICYCKKGLDINPNSFNLFLTMGNAFFKQKQWNQAIECYQKVIEIKPNCYNAYKRLGDILKDNAKLDLAVRYYQKALEIKPEAFYIYRFLGDVFAEQGREAEAKICYQKGDL